MLGTENKPSKYKDSAIDFQLIDRTLAGDSLAYEELFQKYRNRILKLFLRLTDNNLADSEDLLQDTFIKVLLKLNTFNKESGFYTWLHTIAVNIFLMSCRRKKIYTVSIDEIFEKQPVNKELVVQESIIDYNKGRDVRGDIGRLDQVLENVTSEISVNKLLASLPPGYREVIELTYFQGFNGNEAATKMGCSLGNVKSQLSKARHRLRAMC